MTLKHAVLSLSRVVQSSYAGPPRIRSAPEVPTQISKDFWGQLARQNLRIIDDSLIVYSGVSTAVVYNVENGSFKNFNAHAGNIISLTAHRATRVWATADTTGCVYVWDIDSWETQVILEGTTELWVIEFNRRGDAIIAVDNTVTHSVHIWNLNNPSSPVMSMATGMGQVHGIALDRFTKGIRFAIFGEKRLSIWQNEALNTLDMAKEKKLRHMIAGCWLRNGDFAIGADNGFLYIISDSGIKKRIKAHEGPLTAIGAFVDKK